MGAEPDVTGQAASNNANPSSPAASKSIRPGGSALITYNLTRVIELALKKIETKGHILIVVDEPKQVHVVMGLAKKHYEGSNTVRVAENLLVHLGGGRLLIRAAEEDFRADFYRKAVGYTAKFLPTGADNEWTVDPPEPPPPDRFERLLREDL